MNLKRIVLTGGGSGGHVYPLLAVAEAFRKLDPDVEFYYMGPKDAYSEVLERAGILLRPVSGGKFRRYLSGIAANLLDIPRFFLSCIQAWWKMFWIMPEAVFSKGGPGAFPVVLAAWFYRIPVVIHESDATPGLTNLLSSRFARRIAVTFEKTGKYFSPDKVVITGSPLRAAILNPTLTPARAKEQLGFETTSPLVLVLGGSQGSVRINEFIAANLPELMKVGQILHQTGQANFLETKRLTRAELVDISLQEELKARYQPVAYIEDMAAALTAADLVISRSGSNSISEISAAGKPAVLIPLLEAANDHQRANAYEYARTGAAVVIEEPNLLAGIFVHQVREILENPELAGKMAAAAKSFFRAGAAEAIAQEIKLLS